MFGATAPRQSFPFLRLHVLTPRELLPRVNVAGDVVVDLVNGCLRPCYLVHDVGKVGNVGSWIVVVRIRDKQSCNWSEAFCSRDAQALAAPAGPVHNRLCYQLQQQGPCTAGRSKTGSRQTAQRRKQCVAHTLFKHKVSFAVSERIGRGSPGCAFGALPARPLGRCFIPPTLVKSQSGMKRGR